MAIPIIGALAADRPENALSEPDVDLPPPNTAPKVHRLLSPESLKNLLKSEDPLVRAFAIDQIASRQDDPLMEEVIPLIHDDDPAVAVEAILAIESRQLSSAVDDLTRRFASAQARVGAACASALGQIDPDALFAAVKARGRLDDESYAATATALAVGGASEVTTFLNRALDRSGVLSPERRSALFGAALLTGDLGLAGRVIGSAIDDSGEAEPEAGSFPTRGALAVIANLGMEASRQEVGLEVYDYARELIETEILEELEEADADALSAALKTKDAQKVLAALEPVLRVEVDAQPNEDAHSAVGSTAQRRRGILEALIQRASAIGRLEVKAAAIFVVSAAHAAAVVLAGELGESTSPATVALSRALGGTPSAQELAQMDIDALTAVFREQTPRQMRAIVTAATRQSFRRSETLARFARAFYRAGHATALIEAAAEVPNRFVQTSVVQAAAKELEPAEEAVVELLGAVPLEEAQVPLLLRIADEIRTERVALALGRRYFELRKLDAASAAGAMLRAGDRRLLPLLESRAFADEPEEIAWVVLSTVHSVEEIESLAAARARVRDGRSRKEPSEPEVSLILRCEACGEALRYAFERVYLDIEATDKGGDPAFVGPVICKACGTHDRLVATPSAEQILTAYMLEFIQAIQRGEPVGRPLVSPAQTQLDGRKVGMASALRTLEERINTSPDSIRPRLHRARLRIILKREGLKEDIEAVRQVDPLSVEATALEATYFMRKAQYGAAMDKAAEIIRRLDEDDGVRLYDAENVTAFRMSTEDLMVELAELGAPIPPDVSLEIARERRDYLEAQVHRVHEERMARARRATPRRRDDEESPARSVLERDPGGTAPRGPASVTPVGRNDPCPCGSGKKFKKCHGARGR